MPQTQKAHLHTKYQKIDLGKVHLKPPLFFILDIRVDTPYLKLETSYLGSQQVQLKRVSRTDKADKITDNSEHKIKEHSSQ